MTNKWFWVSTSLEDEVCEMGKLGSIIFYRRPEQVGNIIFVLSIQLLMFHLYIGRFGEVVKYWNIKLEHWKGWWLHV